MHAEVASSWLACVSAVGMGAREVDTQSSADAGTGGGNGAVRGPVVVPSDLRRCAYRLGSRVTAALVLEG